MGSKLADDKKIWDQKPLLRSVYRDWYDMIAGDMIRGKSVELGSGIGSFKEFMPEVISSDIDPQPWLDMVFDAHRMPFKSGVLANLVMVDVLHHLANPIKFLNAAARVLKRDGRLIMIEPYPSPWSLLIYKLFHPEPFIFSVDYFSLKQSIKKSAWGANQAIPYLIFFKDAEKFNSKFHSKFKILRKMKFSFLVYPLSGGFGHHQLIPGWLKQPLALAESRLTPLSNLLAFRCYVVLKKIGN